jgi:DNA-binding response OmpR family regulator
VLLGEVSKGQQIVGFCRSLRRIPEAKKTKIIVLSGKLSAARMQELLSLGVQAVIDKPYTIDDLRPRLLRMLGQSSPRSTH